MLQIHREFEEVLNKPCRYYGMDMHELTTIKLDDVVWQFSKEITTSMGRMRTRCTRVQPAPEQKGNFRDKPFCIVEPRRHNDANFHGIVLRDTCINMVWARGGNVTGKQDQYQLREFDLPKDKFMIVRPGDQHVVALSDLEAHMLVGALVESLEPGEDPIALGHSFLRQWRSQEEAKQEIAKLEEFHRAADNPNWGIF